MLNGNQILPAFGSNNIEHEYSDSNKVGFYSGKHVWHWFYICKDGTLIFDHSYSQNTGKTKKGFSQSQIAERLAERLSKPLCPDCNIKLHYRGFLTTDWYGRLDYYRCHNCETTFVSRSGEELEIAAPLN